MTTIAIAGPSGAGKSATADAVAAWLENAVVLRQDWFFLDIPDATPEANFCDPRFLDWAGFELAVASLARGVAVSVPRQDESTFDVVGTRTVLPAEYVVVEGMTVLRRPSVLQYFDHVLYLSPSVEEIAKRKHERDATHRGRTAQQAQSQLEWVLEEHVRELATLPDHAVVIDGDQPLDAIVQDVVQRLAN